MTVPDGQPAAGIDALTHRRRWRILAVLILSLIVISLDNTILNVALPDIQRSLHASSSALQWVVDGYMLAFAALLLLAGNLGDRDGRKLALQFGLLTFAAGSVGAVCADSTVTLLVARIVMGIGAAFIMPSTLSIASNVFAGPERTKAIAIWTASAGIGVALGPVAGGWLLEHFWWGSVFLINIPIVVVAFVVGARIIPESRDAEAGAPDKLGAALASVAFTAVVYGIIAAPEHGWTSLRVFASLAVAAAFLAVFVRVELRSENPILPMWFFRNPSFTAASVCIMFVFFALYGSLYLLTQYLQVVRGYSPLGAGWRTVAVAAGIGAAAPLGPHLGRWFGNRWVVAGGLTLTAGGMSTFIWLGRSTDYALAALGLVLTGLGMGATMAPATDAIVGSVPVRRSGVGSAVNDMVRELGGALGVAVLGSLLTARYAAGVDADLDLGPRLAGVKAAADDSVGTAHVVAGRVGHATGTRVEAVANDAFVAAMHVTIVVAVFVLLVGAVVAAGFLPSAPAVSQEPGSATAPPATPAVSRGRHRRLDDPPVAPVSTPDLGPPSHAGRRVRRRNKEAVARVLLEVVAHQRLDLIDDLYRPDVVDHDPLPGAPPGRDGVRYTITKVHQLVPDYRVEIVELTAVEDLVIARCHVAVRRLRPVATPGQGRYAEVTTVWRLVDGRIAERWALQRGARARVS